MKGIGTPHLFAVPLLISGLIAPMTGANGMDIARSPVAAVFEQFDSQNLDGISYIGGANSGDIRNLSRIRKMVLEEGRRYFVDLGGLSESQKKNIKQGIQTNLGVSFESDWLFIGRHKNNLIFTPLRSLDDAALRVAVNRADEPAASTAYGRNPKSEDQATLPHVAFYVDVNRPIHDWECTFPNSHFWEKGSRTFCNNGNISLVYRVNLMRSLAFGLGGSATPDAKLVRISLDEQSGGAGIQLNDRKLSWREAYTDRTVVDGWTASHSTDAIAKDYRFTIDAVDVSGNDQKTASILKTYPASNFNANFEHTEVSGFEIGVGRGIKSTRSAPKLKLEPQFSYRQDLTLSYKTEDYRVVRSSPDSSKISFIWERQQYPTAESLLNVSTSPAWDNLYPIDSEKISALSYRGITPNFDVIYRAAPAAKGVTRFYIDSSVNIWAIYDAIYQHFYVVGTHKSYQAKEQWQKYRRVSEIVHFDVDWDHPVFTGGRPVNIQLGDQNNSCIANGPQGKVIIEACDLKSNAQSFIYDQYGRYVSAANAGQCLDGNDLTSFKPCDASLTQRWEWKDPADMLENEYVAGSFLAHDMGSNRMTLASPGASNVSTRMLTKFTDIFSE
ncbi:leukocidin family pore-forming toxin [Paraburkholderia bryophila]|uniref:leukocidin family pore-forming toxin n=1 Tax=Burkholderiaceae TaxID=119060 RepID=UPI000689FBE2|nr:leukocidin family pore-forming toxin [Burkholderia sp. 9120]